MSATAQSDSNQDSESGDAHDDSRLGDSRGIYSSSSKRSFGNQKSEPIDEETKSAAKPQRRKATDETKPAPDETDVTEDAGQVKKAATQETKKSEGDEAPPALDKSVDEGPL